MPQNDASSLQYFTSEAVSMGHPDKVADQISDALLDSVLRHDPNARTAFETLVTTGLVVVAGEFKLHTPEAWQAMNEAEETIRDTIRQIGYDDAAGGFDYRSCAVLRSIHGQSPDISQGVTEGEGRHTEQGAGDQGMMFGFACNETAVLMPLPIHLAQRLVERHAELRQKGEMTWLRPDAKSQVTVTYRGQTPVGIDTVVFATQHVESVIDPKTGHLSAKAEQEIKDKIIRPVIEAENAEFWTPDIKFHINPTGRFVIGGPHGDAGLTGRKIIVDTYGGRGRHGGGAFSGKDPSKVDRSAAYMARYIAKNVVAAQLADSCEVQLAYAIGVAEPVSVFVDTFGSSAVPEANIERAIREVFPLTPSGIIKHLQLRRPVYFETARHGHFGRTGDGFTWECTDRVEALKAALQTCGSACA